MDKVGFFEEKAGVKSNIRLNSTLCVVGSLVMGIMQIIQTGEANETLVIGLAGTALGIKAYQKSKGENNG